MEKQGRADVYKLNIFHFSMFIYGGILYIFLDLYVFCIYI